MKRLAFLAIACVALFRKDGGPHGSLDESPTARGDGSLGGGQDESKYAGGPATNGGDDVTETDTITPDPLEEDENAEEDKLENEPES